MQQRSTLREYLYFNRKERNGILLLLAFSVGVAFLPVKKWVHRPAHEVLDDSLGQQLVDLSMQALPEKDHDRPRHYDGGGHRREVDQWTTPAGYFYFDPNTLDEAGWRKLGLPERTIGTLRRYVEKGGRFRRAEDLRKIWGIPPERAEQLIPYVRITEVERTESNLATVNSKPGSLKSFREPATLDVNLADTTAWIALPGIGRKLAARIVGFREKLGGFVSVAQVSETYGLSDSTFQLIRGRLVCANQPVRTLHLNQATLEQFKAHPYIRYPLASAIIQYRNQHGPFVAVGDLQKLVVVTPEIFAKISPYLTVKE
jgi:DNA uptake protein ComE-like DNA-binding protein